MAKLNAGFARVDITPMMGIQVRGYYKLRIADGVLDRLELNALALSFGEERIVLLSMNHCGIKQEVSLAIRQNISTTTGLPLDAIFLHATHIHTGPTLDMKSDAPLDSEYFQFVCRRAADAAQFALKDLKPAKMGWRISKAHNIAFIRRFRMKDGSIQTNPGVDNPNILEPIGDVDEDVNVLRFDREGDDTLILVNFGNHPDVVGGCKISADWPGFLRHTVEKTIDGTRCIFFNGAQGDVNHVNVHPVSGDLNDMFMDFDDVSRGYGHARHIGRVMAGAVLQVYDKVKYVDTDSLHCLQRVIHVPANLPDPSDLPRAREIEKLHRAGKDAELPYSGMMLTTKVAEAERMLRLEHGPNIFDMTLSAVSIGNVALIGIPGEPFTGVGRGVKDTEGWDLILPCCLTNGAQGYFPMKEAYDEGGYEAASSPFRSGVAEIIIEESKKLLNELQG